jgi:hypothetical protein
MESIKTRYKSINFRSRLEAKWARFFDLLGWKWAYEPIDFKGWIPDFALYGNNDLVYVEVKPIVSFPKDVAKKIAGSGVDKEVLIVGQVCPLPIDEPVPYIGWLCERGDWALAAFGRWVDGKGQIGFCHTVQAFTDRISGGYDGGCYGGLESPTVQEINQLWAEACNAMQWRGDNGETY